MGSGFSTNAGIPLQKEFAGELFSEMADDRLDQVTRPILTRFLRDIFAYDGGSTYPTLEDIFTCVDLSANSGHNLGRDYPPAKLRALRRFLIRRAFLIFNKHRGEDRYGPITSLLDGVLPERHRQNYHTSFIVLNWDIVLENALGYSIVGSFDVDSELLIHRKKRSHCFID